MDTSSSTSTPPPPPPPTGSILNSIETKLTPGILLIIAILAIVFFIFGLLNLLVQNLLRLRRGRRLRRQVGNDGSPTAFQGQLQQLFHLHDAGVDQAFIDALPVFMYRAIVGVRKDPFDCAVCLCEFDMDDKLRLLPTCGHAFHVPCIDAWLLSHSTCPLCRGSILADLSLDSSLVVLVLESERLSETVRDGEPGGPDNEGSPKAEEVVEVKLGKLRCVDGNGNAGELAVEGGSSSNANGSGNGRGNLGQRRCLSMGSYEYVMDEHAVVRVAIKTPKRRPASSRSRRQLALSECDFGRSKKGAWEMAVTEAASGDAGSCGDGAAVAARLKKDSFSVSKIWMVSAKKDDGRTAELAAERRAVSFRWPAMAEVSKKQGRSETAWDVEAGSCGSNGVSSLAEERPSLATTTLLWVVGGSQQSSRVGSHS